MDRSKTKSLKPFNNNSKHKPAPHMAIDIYLLCDVRHLSLHRIWEARNYSVCNVAKQKQQASIAYGS